jgi:hypothetical protein
MKARLDEVLGGGYFLAAPHTIGATDDEIKNFHDRDHCPTDRQQAIYFALGGAMQSLLQMPPQGHA